MIVMNGHDNQPLAEPTSIRPIGVNINFDLHPDGKRVAAAVDQSQIAVQDHVVIMSNFFGYLRQIAPAKK